MSKQKINTNQKRTLLELLENKPRLRAGKFSAGFTHKDAQEQWEEITYILNAIPGACKDWKAWRKTWQDILSKTKAKSATINRLSRGTGGGPPPPALDEFEVEVAALIHPHAIAGHTQTTESDVTFEVVTEDPIILPAPDHAEVINVASSSSLPQVNDVTVLPPPIEFGYELSIEPASVPTPNTSNRPPKKKVKTNLKSLLEEKVKIKKETLKEKKKWYEGCLSLLERHTQVLEEQSKKQTKALEDISKALENIKNVTSR